MRRFWTSRPALLARVLFCALLGGCATTDGADPRDPLEPINRGIYVFNDHIDHLFLKPAAEAYHMVLPNVVQLGLSNFFSNLNDVLIAANNLLQGKPKDAASDVGRVAINTTVGILGFFDPASDMGLQKHDEDFGQTLGRWGVGDGPYLVLPFFGPSNFRDATGRLVDYYGDPVTYVDPTRDRNQIWGLRAVGQRAELLGASNILQAAALDPYVFLRDAYLQRRRSLIYDGKPPPEDGYGDGEQQKDGGGAAEPPPGSGSPGKDSNKPAPPSKGAPSHRSEAPVNAPRIVRYWSGAADNSN